MQRFPIILCILLGTLICIRLVLMVLLAPKLNNGQHLSFTTTLLSEPKLNKSSSSVKVWYSNQFNSQAIILTIPPGKSFHYADTIAISGTISIKALGNTRPVVTMKTTQISLVSQRKNPVLAVAYSLQQEIKKLYEKSLSPFFSTLLLGVVLGGSSGFTKAEISRFQTAGVMHVVAASGMNVTLVTAFLIGIFSRIKLLGRRLSTILAIVGLCLYICLSGFQASILRAGVMGVCMLLGQVVGRQYNGLWGLFLAACIMLLVNPTLVGDVGFQLSFAATLGIFLIKPKLPFKNIAGEDITTSLAAQIATLPILLTSFGTYGLLSILVNALILWTIPILMVLGGVGTLVGLVFEPLGRIIIIASWPFLFYFQQVVWFFSQFHLNLQVQNLSAFVIVGYYLILLSWVLYKRKI